MANRPAPNAPCATRAAIRAPSAGASAAHTLKTVNPPTSSSIAGRRPTVSSHRPVGSASAAIGSR